VLASETTHPAMSDIEFWWLYISHPEQLEAAREFYEPMPPDLFAMRVVLGSPAPEQVDVTFLFDPDYFPMLTSLETGPMRWLAHEPIPGTASTPLVLTFAVPPPSLPGDED
jgi:hypothetical protein